MKFEETIQALMEAEIPEWVTKGDGTGRANIKMKGKKVVYSGNWTGGTWENGTFNKGIWKDGVWLDGIFKKGTWENGTFKNGKFSGNWQNGTFEGGIFDDGTWDDGTWENGTWKSGWIKDSEKVGNYREDWRWSQDLVYSEVSPAEYFNSSSAKSSTKIKSKNGQDIKFSIIGDQLEIATSATEKIKLNIKDIPNIVKTIKSF